MSPAQENGQPTVLVIDDDRIFRSALQYVLHRNAGFNVVLAEDGTEGLSLALQTPPDVVICDVMMREMHGYATVEALRSHAATQHVPIIMMTGRRGSLGERRARMHGADHYVYKPVNFKELIDLIRTVLAQPAS
jgi:DNA-binding response OmpR family regulator